MVENDNKDRYQKIPGSNPGRVYKYLTTRWPNGKASDYGNFYFLFFNFAELWKEM
jgi:hypothetical protein